MKTLMAAALATALMTTAAVAQTEEAPAAAPATEAAAPVAPSRCGEAEPAPTPPDAATATADQMQEGIASYEAWRTATETHLACRRAEALELRSAADQRAQEFNALNQVARDTGTAWQAAAEAYNERQPRRRR